MIERAYTMKIYISPVPLVIMVVIITNVMISFSKNKILSKFYLLLSAIFSFVGVVGMIVLRPYFIYVLNKSTDLSDYEPDFITWAIEKFESFAINSIVVNCVVILCLLCYLSLNKRKSGFIWANTTRIVIIIMIFNFVSSVWYGLGTINKLFDIARFITQISVAEFFSLHIPLVMKRILISKNQENNSDRST